MHMKNGVKDMFNCESCLKNDVCGKKENSNFLVKNLDLNPAIQLLKNSGFKFELECTNYAQVQSTKILGEKYEHKYN